MDRGLGVTLGKVSKRTVPETKAESTSKAAESWFINCSGTQLKALCKAAGLKISGTKMVLAGRLC
ncbi:hypothetical protein KIPB_011049, partial [Kipferlia bialata]|eukprot:g11049.t1